jgi:hypothetical protein
MLKLMATLLTGFESAHRPLDGFQLPPAGRF